MDNLDRHRLIRAAAPREAGPDRRERVLGAPSIEYLAQALASSGCNLDSMDSCIEALIARGIRPSSVGEQYDEIVAQARRIREQPPGLAERIVGIWFFVAMVPIVAFASTMGG